MEEQEELMQEPYGQSQPMMGEATTILQQTNPEDSLVVFEHILQGEIYDENEGRYVKPTGSVAFMNQQGVSQCMFLIRGLVNRNCILSTFDEREVKMMMKIFTHAIIDCLILNFKKFGMEKRNISTVISFFEAQGYAALKRAYLGGEKTFLKNTSKESIITTTQRQPAKTDSVFANFFKK